MLNQNGEYIGCCARSEFVDAWVQLPIFKVKYCTNCCEPIMDTNHILEKIWTIFFAPFWIGIVHIKSVERN
jgi:hypothetical protein